jgi:hypothetical protein
MHFLGPMEPGGWSLPPAAHRRVPARAGQPFAAIGTANAMPSTEVIMSPHCTVQLLSFLSVDIF